MIWILAPLAIWAGKAIYDAVTDDSEAERNRQEQESRQQREQQRKSERELEQRRALEKRAALQRKAQQDQFVIDAQQHVARFYDQQKDLLVGTVAASAQGKFTFPDLKRFVLQELPQQPQTSQAMLDHLSNLVPGTNISPSQRDRDQHIASLERDIAALQKLASTFTQGAAA